MENIIHSNLSVSVTELKKNLTALLTAANQEPIAILNHRMPVEYLFSAAVYGKVLDLIEDLELVDLIRERQKQKEQAISISLDDL